MIIKRPLCEKAMGFYLIKRLLLMITLFIGITIISFGVIHLAPGSPIDMATDLNPKATAEVKERMRAFYGLDQPVGGRNPGFHRPEIKVKGD
jgi:ABC-type dipeptide/oligopeptide/nickel transport system permease component